MSFEASFLCVCFITSGCAGNPLYTPQAMSTLLLNPFLGPELSEKQHGVSGSLFYGAY